MLQRELVTQNQPTGTLLRQPKDEEFEESQAQMKLARQRDPLASLSGRHESATAVQAQAEALNRAAGQPPTIIAPSLLGLQQRYGNRFVQRVIKLKHQGKGETNVAPEVEQTIHAARGGGQSLDSGVRAQMEPAFRADFSGVRVHTDGQADTLNRALSARAFATGHDIFFKQGEYSPGSSTGRELLAHELTHVVQQNGGQVQAKLTLGQPGDKYEQEADRVARAIMQREQRATPTPTDQKQIRRQNDDEQKEEQPVQPQAATGAVQRQTEDEENAQTKLEGSALQPPTNDPENEKDKLQSKADFQLQRQAEDDEEQVQTKPAFALIERQADEKEEQSIIQGKSEDAPLQRQPEEEEQTVQTRPDPGSILRQSEEEEPVQTKADVAAIRRQPEEKEAEESAIQRESDHRLVQRQTQEKDKDEQIQTMIGDGQVQRQVTQAPHHAELDQIPIQRQTDVAEPQQRQQSATTDAPAPKQNLGWLERGAVWGFEKALGAAGIDQKEVMGLVNRAGSAFMQIIQHPGRFLSSIIKAIGQGFTQFKDNIGQHLMSGLLAWLFGAIAKAGLQLPKDFSLKSILGLVLQVLGITPEQIQQRLAKVIGEKNVQRIQKAWGIISTFMRDGLGGLWTLLKEYIGNLKEMVLEEVKSWLIVEVVKAAVLKVVTMFNPVTGLIAIVKTIYNVVKFLIERARQIAALFQAVAGSVVELALGNFKAAADKIELALARLIPIVIGFLASLLGISGIGEKVKTIIKKIQEPVEKAIDKVIGGIAKGLKKLGGAAFSKIKSGVDWTKAKVKQAKEWAKGKAQQVRAWFKRKFESTFEAKGERHRIWIEWTDNQARVMVATDEKELDALLKEYGQKIDALPEEKRVLAYRVYNKLTTMRAELNKITKQIEQTSTTKNGDKLKKKESSLQSQITLTANLLKTIMSLTSQPQGFNPGVFQYGGLMSLLRATGGKGWLAPWKGKRGQEQVISGPINKKIKYLKEKRGIDIQETFDAGHLIADEFGGDGVRENLVPMQSRQNKSYWRFAEQLAGDEVRKGQPVHITAEVKYDDEKPFESLLNESQQKELKQRMNEKEYEKTKEVFSRIPEGVVLTLEVHEPTGKKRTLIHQLFGVREKAIVTFAQVVEQEKKLKKERHQNGD